MKGGNRMLVAYNSSPLSLLLLLFFLLIFFSLALSEDDESRILHFLFRFDLSHWFWNEWRWVKWSRWENCQVDLKCELENGGHRMMVKKWRAGVIDGWVENCQCATTLTLIDIPFPFPFSNSPYFKICTYTVHLLRHFINISKNNKENE